ncbi:fibronectin type III domain-containing protein [Haloferula sargassicola]|uniref:Fibronectin type-III domain-containing protein n=1 Tax=Haloferula sargassicola TaxID=490096 RepID=A0ABP9UR40_9BACT
MMSVASAGPVYEPLASFTAPPKVPSRGALIPVAGEEAFFGLSATGGGEGKGTLYKITKTGTVTTLVNFTGLRDEYPGYEPKGGLWDDGAGWLWGTTFRGGASDVGTVFKYNWHTGTFETVVEFNGDNGSFPDGTLEPDGTGGLWGTTTGGGLTDDGTVFRLRLSDGAFASIISFSRTAGPAPGAWPVGGLTADGHGSLWGVTAQGGQSSQGVVFKVDIASHDYTRMADFAPFPVLDTITARLHYDGEGFLWGTAGGGITEGPEGAVFKVATLTGEITVVHQFDWATTGWKPSGGLTEDSSGNLWGTTTAGLGSGLGGVFKVQRSTGSVTSVAEFSEETGYSSVAPLTADSSGVFWGTATHGGPAGVGSIFKVATRALPASITAVRLLDDDLPPVRGRSPNGGFVMTDSGKLWGTTLLGGRSDNGTVFTLDPESGEIQTLAEFTGTGGAAPGSGPSGLIDGGNGGFWGVTAGGGLGHGTIFKVDSQTRAVSTVVSLTGTTGAAKGDWPGGKLVRVGDWLWGTSRAGGLADRGTVFRVNRLTGAFVTVHEWTGTAQTHGDGAMDGLAPDGSGFLWGVTYRSGSSGHGSVFKIATSTGTYSEVYPFPPSGETDVIPQGPLTAGGDGRMWGVTNVLSGTSGGTLYSLRISGGALDSHHPFSALGGPGPGGNPAGGLLADASGTLWGISRQGGNHSRGAIFRIPVSGGYAGTAVWTLPLSRYAWPAPGFHPGSSPLTAGGDGHYYGALEEAGIGGNGQIFRLRFGPNALTLPADGVGHTSAVLHGLIKPNGTTSAAGFDFGVQPDLATSLPWSSGNTSSGSFYEPVSAQLTGLVPGTTYYFRARATNADNPFPQTGKILSFTTRKPGLADWLLGYGITGPEAGPTEDPDDDGICNALEYIAGSHPGQPSLPAHPVGAFGHGGYTVSFLRADLSETPDIDLSVEAGSDLETWPSIYHIGATTTASSPGVTVIENGFLSDRIEVALPHLQPRLFWRIHVTVTP